MGFKADRAISPTSKLIVNFLNERTTPQSVITISDAVGASYWTTRVLCKELAGLGLLILTPDRQVAALFKFDRQGD